MAVITQDEVGIVLGEQVYWQQAPVTFKGFIAGTQVSVIQQPGYKTCDVVNTDELTTTSSG